MLVVVNGLTSIRQLGGVVGKDAFMQREQIGYLENLVWLCTNTLPRLTLYHLLPASNGPGNG